MGDSWPGLKLNGQCVKSNICYLSIPHLISKIKLLIFIVNDPFGSGWHEVLLLPVPTYEIVIACFPHSCIGLGVLRTVSPLYLIWWTFCGSKSWSLHESHGHVRRLRSNNRHWDKQWKMYKSCLLLKPGKNKNFHFISQVAISLNDFACAKRIYDLTFSVCYITSQIII